jgi:cellobiose phosphorylase
MAEMASARGEDPSPYAEKASAMGEAVNTLGWDGEWYLQGTTDEGEPIGSSRCGEGRIHLNPQTWSIISGTASGKYAHRAGKAMDAVMKSLRVEWGVLLLAPPYTVPDEKLGYITRYAPGCRENGGVYTHASVWAGRAARILGRPELVQDLLLCLLPPVRGRDPRYKAEPYVTPGNIDGPATPTPGRGGWTWYTGSAAWLFRCLLEDLLGVRAEADALVVEPNVPREWDGFEIERPFRGKLLKLSCRRAASAGIVVRDPQSSFKESLDGCRIPADLLASLQGREIHVDVAYVAER